MPLTPKDKAQYAPHLTPTLPLLKSMEEDAKERLVNIPEANLGEMIQAYELRGAIKALRQLISLAEQAPQPTTAQEIIKEIHEEQKNAERRSTPISRVGRKLPARSVRTG